MISFPVNHLASTCCAIEIVIPERAQASGELRAFAADLAGLACLAVGLSSMVILQSLAAAAKAFERHVPTGFLLGFVTVAVSVFIVGVASCCGLCFCLGNKTSCIAGNALTDFNCVHVERDRTVNDIAACAREF